MSQAAVSQEAAADARDVDTHDLGESLGVYQLIQLLGEGGMGRVFLAEHSLLGRMVALKVLRSEYANDPFVVKRFFSEARTVNQISHENIVEITDFVDSDDGTSFIVMEYLAGRCLTELLKDGALGLLRAARIARQIASALGAVHAIGIVHRDLKPDNIMIVDRPTNPDFVKVLDFGAAKLNPKTMPGAVATQAVTLIGTPQYMSPEQATGAPLDHRSDIYALGVVLYELVTGGNPFTAADTWAVIRRQVTLEPDEPETVISMVPPCPDLNDLIMRCLSKDPNDRPDTMADVEAVLHSVELSLMPSPSGSQRAPVSSALRHKAPVEAPSTLMLRNAGLGPGRQRRVIAAVACGGLLAIGAIVASMASSSEPPTAEPAAELIPTAVVPTAAVVSPVQNVLIRSRPSGAEVRRSAQSKSLGKTPLSVQIPGGETSATYTLTLAGYESQVVEVDSNSGAAPVVQLRAKAVPKPAKNRRRVRTPPKAPKVQAAPKATPEPDRVVPIAEPAVTGRNGVIDPFAQ